MSDSSKGVPGPRRAKVKIQEALYDGNARIRYCSIHTHSPPVYAAFHVFSWLLRVHARRPRVRSE